MNEIVEFLRAVGSNQEVLVFLAGGTATLVTQLIKSGQKWQSQAAFTLSLVVGVALGLLASWAQNGFATPEDFVNNFTAVYTVSQFFYKLILEPQRKIQELEAKVKEQNAD